MLMILKHTKQVVSKTKEAYLMNKFNVYEPVPKCQLQNEKFLTIYIRPT